MKVLLIEDEAALLDTMRQYFETGGYTCETAPTLAEALEKTALYEYDVVILDITLPDGNGLDVLPLLKKEHPGTGILILSAKNSLDDKVRGLELGADDYLTKPFHLAELNARIRSLIRRRFFQGRQTLRFHELEIDPANNVLLVNDRPAELTRKEYDLLLYLIANQNRVLTKAAIAEHLWGDYMDLADNFDLVYTHIKNLRRKIAEHGGADYIKTVYGMGYKFTDH